MANNALLYGLLGAGAVYLFLNIPSTHASPERSSSMMTASQPSTQVYYPGYRVNGVIAKSDVGSTKVLPIVQDVQATEEQWNRHSGTKEQKLRFFNAPTAIEKIRAAPDVIGGSRGAQMKEDLKTLGWA